MSTLALTVMGLLCLEGVQAPIGGGQAAQSARPVIEGRVTGSQGRPSREGKVMFAPQNPPIAFHEAWTVAIDAQGHYRIELSTLSIGTSTFPPTGRLRYLALVPGFRSHAGTVNIESGSAKVDVQLTPEEWRRIEILFVDREGKAVPGARVSLKIGGRAVWSQQTSDSQGRCLFGSAPGVSWTTSVGHDEYVPTEFGMRGASADPTSVKVPLFGRTEGRVVDPTGRPLAGIRIGRILTDLLVDAKASEPLMILPLGGYEDIQLTNAEGRFMLAPLVRLDGRDFGRSAKFKTSSLAFCFADEAMRRVFFLRVDVQDNRSPYEITLRPARAVRIPIEHTVVIPSGSLRSRWTANNLFFGGATDPGILVMMGRAKHDAVDDKSGIAEWIDGYWPEGKYHLVVSSAETGARVTVESATAEIVVPTGEDPLSLPPVRMELAPLRRLVGESAPEINATDAQTGVPVRLTDFRGKVVVLDFWGHWCGLCLQAMPHLIDAHDRYRDKPVVIIALHDQSIQGRDELKRRLIGVKRQLWNDRDLPFIVAFDRPDPKVSAGDSAIARGVTIDRYKIRGFPTTLVINQEGKVVASVDARNDGQFTAIIDKLLKTGTK